MRTVLPAELRLGAPCGHRILATWLGTGRLAAHVLLDDLVGARGTEGLADFLLLAGHVACRLRVEMFRIWTGTTQEVAPGTEEVVLATMDAFATHVGNGRFDLARAVLAPLFHHPHWSLSFTESVVRSIVDHRPGELRTYLAEQGMEIM